MVRNLPPSPPTFNSPWEPDDATVEQYFPEQMSWYAAEGPRGVCEDVASLIRKRPWAALGGAVALGLLVALAGKATLCRGSQAREKCRQR